MEIRNLPSFERKGLMPIMSSPSKRLESLAGSRSETMRRSTAQGRDDFAQSFKVVSTNDQQEQIILTMGMIARYIRRFDLETGKRYCDNTEETALLLLTKALKKLKLLILNGLPTTIITNFPYKVPHESTQRVS